MFGNRAFGTSNSITVATAQHENEDLLVGLSRPMEKFSKKSAAIYTVESPTRRSTDLRRDPLYPSTLAHIRR